MVSESHGLDQSKITAKLSVSRRSPTLPLISA